MRLLNRLALLAALPAMALTAAAAPPSGASGVSGAGSPAVPAPPPLARPPKTAMDCLGGQGYLKARIRGALVRDLDWTARLSCDGEARPDGSGVRLSFIAPPGPGRRLRLVFGVRGVREGAPGKELPTNLTVMEEGGRIFATRGDDRCTIDELRQQRVTGAGGRTDSGGTAGPHTWRITARGFCTDPVNALAGDGRIVISRFDFTGVATF